MAFAVGEGLVLSSPLPDGRPSSRSNQVTGGQVWETPPWGRIRTTRKISSGPRSTSTALSLAGDGPRAEQRGRQTAPPIQGPSERPNGARNLGAGGPGPRVPGQAGYSNLDEQRQGAATAATPIWRRPRFWESPLVDTNPPPCLVVGTGNPEPWKLGAAPGTNLYTPTRSSGSTSTHRSAEVVLPARSTRPCGTSDLPNKRRPVRRQVSR